MTTESDSTRKVTVLLAGVGARSAPMLNDFLRKRGCEIALASSFKEVQRMLRERHYDLVLSEFMLSDGTAYQLMSCLRGTDTMMFFSHVVEHGCWWINGISEGQDHADGPGMPEEFKILLDEILLGICRMPTNAGAGPQRTAATTQPCRLAKE